MKHPVLETCSRIEVMLSTLGAAHRRHDLSVRTQLIEVQTEGREYVIQVTCKSIAISAISHHWGGSLTIVPDQRFYNITEFLSLLEKILVAEKPTPTFEIRHIA